MALLLSVSSISLADVSLRIINKQFIKSEIVNLIWGSKTWYLQNGALVSSNDLDVKKTHCLVNKSTLEMDISLDSHSRNTTVAFNINCQSVAANKNIDVKSAIDRNFEINP